MGGGGDSALNLGFGIFGVGLGIFRVPGFRDLGLVGFRV